MTAQAGIFALGTPEHGYLELDLRPGHGIDELLQAVLATTGLLTTVGGANVVIGVRPELWSAMAPEDAPAGAASWTEPLIGPDGFTMPATQHDLWVWVAAGDRTTVFDTTRQLLAAGRELSTVASETNGWLYRHDRDLTGFVDGTENPRLLTAPEVALVPAGRSGAGASVVLHQLWRHRTAEWEALGTRGQELAMGRTKEDSVELDHTTMPPSAHVARSTLVVDGEEQPIFRRNVAYGGATDHGTVFVGFAQQQARLTGMLERMAGLPDGVRDELTRYAEPLTGAYYVVPAAHALEPYAG